MVDVDIDNWIKLEFQMFILNTIHAHDSFLCRSHRSQNRNDSMQTSLFCFGRETATLWYCNVV